MLSFYFQAAAQVSKTEKLLCKRSWVVEKESGKLLSDFDLRKISLKKDGSLTLIRLQDANRKNGSWKLDNDSKILTVNLEGRSSLVFEINKINSKAMTLTKDGEISEAVNVPDDYVLPPKEYSKKLVGSWIVTKRNGEDVEFENRLIKFNADGTSIAHNQSEAAAWETKKNVLVFYTDITQNFEYEVSKDKKKLTLKTKNMILELSKTDKIVSPGKKEPEEEPTENKQLEGNMVIEKIEISGSWKIKNIDGEVISDRKIELKLNGDGNFYVIENEQEARRGKWELFGNSLKLNDVENMLTTYTTLQLENGDLKLSDYYSVLILEKNP